MAIGTYISITALIVIGLNAPTKRHRIIEWITKKSLYTAYKRLTSDPKSHTD